MSSRIFQVPQARSVDLVKLLAPIWCAGLLLFYGSVALFNVVSVRLKTTRQAAVMVIGLVALVLFLIACMSGLGIS